MVAIGLSARLKRVKWGYIGPLTEELHAAAFVQDEWRIIKPLTLIASYRIDRHPLLDNGSPGYAQSPRVSVVVRPFESHAFRASFATAFREPTFLESYMDIRTPVPGVTGASVLTQGNRALRPEQLLSLRAGLPGRAAAPGADGGSDRLLEHRQRSDRALRRQPGEPRPTRSTRSRRASCWAARSSRTIRRRTPRAAASWA